MREITERGVGTSEHDRGNVVVSVREQSECSLLGGWLLFGFFMHFVSLESV